MSSSRPGSEGLRLDIQGLRAVAVLLVVVYHAGVPLLPGGYIGVDVFFVVSGYLITRGLMRRAEASGTVDLVDFYARRVRRILPAALTAIAGTVGLTVAFLPHSRWDGIATDAAYSGLFAVNWHLSDAATDYLVQDEAASPLQHFWSLAVEEQFYLLWPVLVAGAFLGSRRSGGLHLGGMSLVLPPRAVVLGAAVLLTAASLGRSVYLSLADPAAAYFSTSARMHELGLGVLVALLSARLARTPHWLAAILGWTGLAAVLGAGAFFGSSTPFPGIAALVPTLGAAAIIVSGLSSSRATGVGSLLSLRPLRWVGDLSFSLYLWHWPLLVVAEFLLDGLTPASGLAVAGLSFLPAWLSYRYIERPAQRWRFAQGPARAVQVGLAATLAVTACTFTWAAASALRESREAALSASVKQEYEQGLEFDRTGSGSRLLLGAELLPADADAALDPAGGHVIPSPGTATADNPASYRDGCHQSATGTGPTACVYGSDRPKLTIAVVGDSHAAQWLPALVPLAERNSWQVHAYTKSSCPMTEGSVSYDGISHPSCEAWNDGVRRRLLALEPDLVLTSSFQYDSATDEPMHAGLAASWRALDAAGIPVRVLVDPPSPGFHMAECVERNSSVVARCDFPAREGGESGRAAQEAALRLVPEAHPIDLEPWICPEGTCRAVIGDVLVYRDTSHLTATYSTTLAPALGDALRATGIPVASAGA
ncbi:acyltransferase [Citricoccus sp. SGAir0253]|uniref:acyltransferase family protein n=1 Tax=Citricoccus sp. SGAir0253 TaxID=2567881 RepID=UPI0010CD0760|nr:acyltransferase family protein [Citricoccus sp. SGAir0253]QCU77542.1 acyltransferase [Citricoccus sp. SGAir0253]